MDVNMHKINNIKRRILPRYTQLRGPTLLNNHENYGGNSFCHGAENEGL